MTRMAAGSKANGSHTLKDSSRYSKSQQVRWDDCLPLPSLSLLVARGAIAAVSILCFAVSYDGDFVFDDSEAVVGNKDLQSETPITDLLYHDFWGNKLTNTSHKSYRPLTVLTYRWNHQLAGLSPLGFHVANIVLHAAVCLLFLSAFACLLGQPQVLKSGCDATVSKAAFLATLLFAVHPVHTESVAGVVGRADLLCAVFFLASFLAYVRACMDGSKGSVYRPDSIRWPWLSLSVLFCFLATFSKEQGITVIGVCCAFDIVTVAGVDPLRVLGLKKSVVAAVSPSRSAQHTDGHLAQGLSPWVRCFFHRQAVLVTSACLFLLVRLQVMGLSPPTFQVHDNPHSFVNGSLYRGLNYNYLYSINGWLMVNPWWLCFDWSMGCIPTITSLSDWRLVCIVVLWFLIGCLALHILSGELVHEKRCLLLGLALLVVPFLPASNLLFRVGFVIAERNLYLPSAGLCILVTMGTVRLSSYKGLRHVVGISVCLLCTLYIARCVHRSDHWRTELSLYTEGEKVCPLNGKVHYNVAKLQGDRGETDYAIRKYYHAIELNPEYDQAMNNLANILKDRGESMEAESLLTRAITVNPEFAAAWMNLGIVQAQLKKFDASETSYHTAIRHRRKYPDCYYNLGNLYLEQKRHQEALTAWHNATRLRPEHVNAWSNAIILLDNLGHYEQAVKMGEASLKYLPKAPQLWFNIANVQGKLEKWEESERSFQTAIQLDMNQAQYHLNLGVLYHRWGKFDKAKKAYEVALKLDPTNASALENLKMLQNKPS